VPAGSLRDSGADLLQDISILLFAAAEAGQACRISSEHLRGAADLQIYYVLIPCRQRCQMKLY